MSIKILERGQPIAERSYEAKCPKCNSVLQWLHTDANRVYSGDQREGPFTQIDCPVCSGTVTGY